MTVMNWQEQLSTEDQPPRKIWHDAAKLGAHFSNLRKKWRGEETMHDVTEGATLDDIGRDAIIKNRLGDYVDAARGSDDDFNRI